MKTCNKEVAVDTEVRRLGFIFAMEGEAMPFVEELGLTHVPGGVEGFAAHRFCGEIGNLNVDLVTNGKDSATGVDRIGTIDAALATQALLLECRPDLLINAGTAGGFEQRGGAIGDIYLATGVQFHDHRVPLPGFDVYGLGAQELIPAKRIQQLLEAKSGLISTGDSLDMSTRDLDIILEHKADIKDMEAAAIARVARDNGVAFLAVKTITDIADREGNHEEFFANYTRASAVLSKALIRLVEFFSTDEPKRLSEL